MATNGIPGGATRPPLAAAPVASVDDKVVAEFLLSRRYHLAALEFHQELLEGNNGVHHVEVLNKFFNEPGNFSNLVRSTEVKAKENKAAALGDALRSLESPFAVEGLQSAVASRDQQIAMLQFELRRKESDVQQLKSQLLEGIPGAGTAGNDVKRQPVPNTSYVSAWLGSDEDGSTITQHERKTVNALVRRYLLARGYKATVVAFADEVTDQDLGPHAEDSDLILLPGAKRSALISSTGKDEKSSSLSGSPASAGGPVLSLLSMHRQRIAPIQALVESEAKNDSEIERLKTELKAVHEELESTTSALSSTQKRVEELQADLIRAQTVRGNATASTPVPAASLPSPNPTAPLPSVGGTNKVIGGAPGASSTISMAHAPALLRVVNDAIPVLTKHLVTRQRSAIIPIVTAAIATDANMETRRNMLVSMLSLIRRPSHAERQLIRTQVGVLASKLGASTVENEILPEIILLSKTGKTKERKALAAVLCGAIATHISEKRCDTLLATLADLSESNHAIVRLGVIDGLAQVAQSLSDRWSRALQTGSVVGTNTAMEQASTRQFSQVEYVMWRCLFHNTDERDTIELGIAAQSEFTLQLPPSLALFGTPAAMAALQQTKPDANAAQQLQLPANWSTLPTAVTSAVSTQLVPVVILWSYRLGQLWNKFLPQVMGMLAETLQAVPPSDGSSHSRSSAAAGAVAFGSVGLGPKAAATPRLVDWHQQRVQLILSTLSQGAQRIKQCMFDEGYTLQFLGDAEQTAAADGTQQASPAAESFIYELFDFASQAAVQSYPPEIAFSPRPGAPAPPAPVPAQQRQANIMAALVKGTVAARRRRNISPTVELPAGVPPYQWQAIRDEMVGVSWPSLKFVVRSLVAALIRQAACVHRTSQVGRQIVDAYADALNSICTALGPAFTSYVARPMFLRAFGIPLDLPPLPPAPAQQAPAAPGTPQPGAYTGRPPMLVLAAQVLLGMPANAAEARRAATLAASGDSKGTNGASTVNFASAGPKGGEWPLVLGELNWLHRDSPDNPANWSGRNSAKQAADPSAVLTGGVWNAEALLPLYGSAIMACPALQPRDLLEHSIRAFIVLVSTNRLGWGGAQALLEDFIVRAGGGASAASSRQDGSQPTSPVASPTAAVLQFMLSDIFPRAASAVDPAIRTCVASLYRSLLPLLSAAQLESHFLPSVKKLASDTQLQVRKAAVRALAFVYSSSAGGDSTVQEDVNAELRRLLADGPKDIIVEILRAMMRAVPTAAANIRDGFILDRLLEVNERVVHAAEIGAQAMKEFCATVGNIAPGDIHSAAAQAARKARAAAVQAEPPWQDAKLEDLDEVAMVLCESFRAFGSCMLGTDLKNIIHDAATSLLNTDLLDPAYRNVMQSTFASMFPADSDHTIGVEETPVDAHLPGDHVQRGGPSMSGMGVDKLASMFKFGGSSGGGTEVSHSSSMHGYASQPLPTGKNPHDEPDTLGAGFVSAHMGGNEAHGDGVMSSFGAAFKSTGKYFGLGALSGQQTATSSPASASHAPAAVPVGFGFKQPSMSFTADHPPRPAQPPAHAPAPAAEPAAMSMAAFSSGPARRNSGSKAEENPPAFDMSAFTDASTPHGDAADQTESGNKWGMGKMNLGVGNLMRGVRKTTGK